MTNTQLLRDLLAIMHRDGGHHTCEVGIEKSVRDAEEVFWQLSRERDAARAHFRRACEQLARTIAVTVTSGIADDSWCKPADVWMVEIMAEVNRELSK